MMQTLRFIIRSWYFLAQLPAPPLGIPNLPPIFISSFLSKFFPATYDETLYKFLLYTYEDSHNSFWSKILSREHVEYIYIAWVENVNFKNCNFSLLRGIFWGVSIKQKWLKFEKYQDALHVYVKGLKIGTLFTTWYEIL